MSIFDRVGHLFGGKKAKPSEEKSWTGGGYSLPISGGFIPSDFPWNFWQMGKDPVGGGKSSIAAACVDAYSHTIASLRAHHVYVDPEKGGKRFERSTALAMVLRSPNAYQTRSDFMMNLIARMLYSGNGYALAYRDERNAISSLHLVPHSQAYVEPDTREIFYAIGGNPLVPTDMSDVQALVPARDVLHIRLFCPQHPLIGVSPIRNLAHALASTQAIGAHQAVFFNNMSRPSGILTTDEVLKREQMALLREAWQNQSKQLNSGGVPILSNGLKWQSLAIDSQDAQMIDSYNMGVEEIARAFRVPLPLIGDQRHSTYNNVEQLVSSWLAMGLGFVLEHVEQSISRFFQLQNDHFCEFDTDSLLRTDFAGRIDALTKGIQGGLYSPDEARRKEGLAIVDDGYGEEPRLQAQVVPLSQVGMEPAAAAPAAEPAALPAPVDDDATPAVTEEERSYLVERAIRKEMKVA